MQATLEIQRTIVVNASRERVWKAITTPEKISQWFEKVSFDGLEAGAPMTMTEHREITMEVALVEPMDRFGWRWKVMPPDPTMTLVVFTLETVPEGTRVTVRETGFDALPADLLQKSYQNNNEGWDAKIADLAAYLRADDDPDSNA